MCRSDDGSPDREIERAARRLLDERCSFAGYFRDVQFRHDNGTLTLRGKVPSFYMKQVLQTVLRDLPHDVQIDNRVDVVSCTGLSSAIDDRDG